MRSEPEENYSFLVHTSGKTDDHNTDRKIIEDAMMGLVGELERNLQRSLS